MFELLTLVFLLLPAAAFVCLVIFPDRYRALGYKLLIAFGAILLIGPGGCALFFLAASVPELAGGKWPDYYEAVLVIAGISLVIAAGGFFTARYALRRLRQTP